MFRLEFSTCNAEFKACELTGIKDTMNRVLDQVRVMGPCSAGEGAQYNDGVWRIRDINGSTIGEWCFVSEQD